MMTRHLYFAAILLVILDVASCWTSSWRQMMTPRSRVLGKARSSNWPIGRCAGSMCISLMEESSTPSLISNEADVMRYLRCAVQNTGTSGSSRTKWSSMDKMERSCVQAVLTERISRGEEEMSKKSNKEAEKTLKFFSDALYMLGKLKANPKYLDSSFLDEMWDYFHLCHPATLNKYIGKILYSVASMGIKWNCIPPKTRKIFVSSFTFQLRVMNELAVVNVIYSLGKMGAGWSQLPVHTRNGICVNLVRVSDAMDSRAVANVFWGLGQTRARWSTLPGYVQACLSYKLEETTPLGAQALSSTLNGLKNANGQWRYFNSDLKSTILANMGSSLRSGASEQSVATIIGSLGAMNLAYDELDYDIRESVEVAVSRVSTQFTNEGLSSTFHGLARMGWTAQNLSPSLWQSLEAALQRVVSSLGSRNATSNTARVMSSLMWSLGQLEMMWHRTAFTEGVETHEGESDYHLLYSRRRALSKHSIELLSSALEENAMLMNEQGIFSTLSGFAKMGAEWQHLGKPLTNALTASLRANSPYMRTKAVCHTLWALGCVGVKWNNLAEMGLQEPLVNATIRVSAKLNTQGVSIALYSLAALECKYDSLPFTLKVAIQGAIMRNSGKASGREVAIMLYSLGRMDANINTNFSKKARRNMLDSMERTVESMDEQNLGNAIWGLFGKMHEIYSKISPEFRRKVASAIVGKRESLNEKSLMSILHGFSRPGAEHWENLDTPVQICLLYTTERIFMKSEGQNYDLHLLAGNVLYAFGRLGLGWERSVLAPPSSEDDDTADVSKNDEVRMSESLQNLLLENLIRREARTGPFIEVERSRAISFGLNGLAQMTTWQSMTEPQRRLVSRAVHMAVPTLLPVDIANVMWSLGRLGVPITSIPTQTLGMLFQAVRDTATGMKPFELVWTLWALNRMQVTFPTSVEGTEELYETILGAVVMAIPSMTMQELGVMIFSMTSMSVDMNEPSLVNEIFKKLHPQ